MRYRWIVLAIGLMFALQPAGIAKGGLPYFNKEKKRFGYSDDRAFSYEFGIGYGSMSGDNTYGTYDVGYDGSQLEFPVDMDYMSVFASMGLNTKAYGRNEFDNNWGPDWKLSIRWETDVSDKGVLKDSDWIAGDGHDGLDIYSETASSLSFDSYDINISKSITRTKWFGVDFVVGYKKEDYQYVINDGYQWGYGPYAATDTTPIYGPALDYDLKYTYFYIGAAAGFYILSPNFRINLFAGYAPDARAEHRDDHLLRQLLSEGKTDGDVVEYGIGASYNLSDWMISLEYRFRKVDTKGEEDSWYYDGSGLSATGIPLKIESEVDKVEFSVSRRF